MSVSTPSAGQQKAFFRVAVNDSSFIRGAARLLCAQITQDFPAEISDVITFAPQTGQSDVQTISETAATAGTFTLSLDGVTSATIPYNATAAAIQTALQAMSNVG